MDQRSFFQSALKSGLIVGLLDGTAACVNAYLQRKVGPLAVFRYVASGAFGRDALTGGWDMVMWGLFFHFFIAVSWTFLFYFLYTRMKLLQSNKIYVGIMYGVLVWLGMNFVVLPLSNVPPLTYKLIPTVIMIGIHMFVIGLSISLLANHYFSAKRIAA
ncbi:MAG TPA: hypothetical protein VL728_17725 [Cyclobacteriaceae bacterium]|jgi:hypothetical protein|nr:hypothetical protein [Cyclobacteriaceae bacterium]